MKNFIHTKNQWLLERYPTVWNTKIVWMLAIAAVLHILFFGIGILCFLDPERLQQYNALDFYFKSGVVFISIILSVLLLLVWLITMFRNNAFKNFYPFSRSKLFIQFVHYLVIFLACTTFYYSFTLGFQTFISVKYDDQVMAKDVAAVNVGMPLLPFELSDYELDRLRLPSPFDTLYCITNRNKMSDRPYNMVYRFKSREYQFWTYNKIEEKGFYDVVETGQRSDRLIHTKNIRDKRYLYYKVAAQNVEIPTGTSAPSFYNYSDVFYENTQYEETSYPYAYEPGIYDDKKDYNELTPPRRQSIINNQNLLQQGEQSVHDALRKLDKIAERYQIKNNIQVDQWIKRQSYAKPYEIQEIINKSSQAYDHSTYVNDGTDTEFKKYERSIKGDLYFDATSLDRAFSNIDDIKESNIFEGSIHFFLWIAFTFSLLVLSFRAFGLKSLLFSLVSIGVVTIACVLLILLGSYILPLGLGEEDLAFLVFLGAGFTILAVTFFRYRSMKKLIAAILNNVSLFIFIPCLVGLVSWVNEIRNSGCSRDALTNYEDCRDLVWELLGIYWSYLFFAAGLLFLFFFCKRLMNWRAMPEG